MDNTKCILLRFTNEQDVNIGYLDWLDKSNQENVMSIISDKKEISIMWPNCDIVPKIKIMQTNLDEATYRKRAATVLASGSKYKTLFILSTIFFWLFIIIKCDCKSLFFNV